MPFAPGSLAACTCALARQRRSPGIKTSQKPWFILFITIFIPPLDWYLRLCPFSQSASGTHCAGIETNDFRMLFFSCFGVVQKKKSFYINGEIVPQKQARIFFVSPDAWIRDKLMPRVENDLYTIMHGVSQSGKTTKIKAFMNMLSTEPETRDKYMPL
jgi:hypothetical protein